MVFERWPTHHPAITVDSDILECVSEFTYLGSLITTNNDCSAEIARRINLSSQRMGMLKTSWSSSELSTKTKIDVLVSCVFSRLLCAAETWTIKAIDARKLLAFEMRCYRRILKVCWKDKVRNKVIRERAKRQWTVMDLIKQQKLKLFGHICRMGDRRLIKTVMLGMVNGNRLAEDRQRGGQTTL